MSKVESSKVCMVNNMVFPNEQIPVEVSGKTYYGCCAMCKKTLSEDKAARTAVDPVSGEAVDKADAVIAADSKGRVLYFKSTQNLDAYNAGKGT